MDLADQARKTSQNMIDKLETYRSMIVERAGGMAENDEGEMRIKREDDLEAATSYMITEGKGEQMKNELAKFKSTMADYVDNLPENMRLSKDDEPFDKKLPLNLEVDGGGQWAESMFTMVPAVAATTIIDKYKNDVKNSESVVLDELWANAMGEATPRPTVEIKDFNKFGIIASLDNSYALPGQTLNLTSMLGAYNADAQSIRIWVNGSQVNPREGIAERKIKASSKPGKHSIKIRAQYKKRGKNDKDVGSGVWTSVPEYTLNYFVGQPQASISLDKMNVFYRGLENPMTIAASGVRMSDLEVTHSSNIKLVKKGLGKYHVLTDNASGKAWVKIRGKRSDGGYENYGKYDYRLDRVPPPAAEIAGKKGGSIPVNTMRAQRGIFAKLKGFPYELPFKVVSFRIVHVPKRGEMPAPVEVTGNFLNDSRAPSAVRDVMKSLKVGDRIFFEEVRAKGPDGRTVKINGLSFYMPN
jgi:gliding motility-associated protein GldM